MGKKEEERNGRGRLGCSEERIGMRREEEVVEQVWCRKKERLGEECNIPDFA